MAISLSHTALCCKECKLCYSPTDLQKNTVAVAHDNWC